MTDDARRVAIEAIVRIDTTGAYANILLPRMLGETDLDSRDRGLVTELVYGATRRRRSIDHVVDRFLVQDPAPRARAALRIGGHQLLNMGTPPHAAVSATVDAAPRRYRGLVNAVLRRVAAAAADGICYPSAAVELSCPDWILEHLTADLGAEAARAALETMNRPARVHRRPDGYVQDLSSQLVAEAVAVRPGERVLDQCGAPGGKATALAAAGARVVAGDLRRGRARLIVSNRDRLGLEDLHVAVADAVRPPFARSAFDAVLVDAPCSGLGTLRRRPDARWRITPDDVVRLAELQATMLAAAAPLVRPGGRLVYSVCTLTRAEGVGPTSAVPADFVALDPPAGPWQPFDGPAHMMLPGDDHDGATIACWRRPRRQGAG